MKNTEKFYSCIINHAIIDQANEEITTNIARNILPSENITSLEYKSENTLKFIPKSIFQQFPQIQLLFISNSKLTQLKQNYFKNAENLKFLKISQNPLKELADDTFGEALNLDNINLEQNEIEMISRYAFRGLSKVSGIFLASNKIKFLPFNTFDGLSSLLLLSLEFNICINFKFGDNFDGAVIDPMIIEIEIWKDCSQDFNYKDLIVD